MESMAVDCDSEPEIDVDEEDLEKLESDLKGMAKKISEYRQTLPDHLKNTLDSVLSSRRPNFDSGSGSGSGSTRLTITETEAPPVVLGTEELEESREKMIQIKERLSKNVETIPRVVKRMRDCIERIDKLDSSTNGITIHPAFTRRRIN